MPNDFVPHYKLTHEGALKIVGAAVDKARAMGVPQCIAVVDGGGHLLAFVRMDGAKFLSIETAMRKALTAVSGGRPTGGVSSEAEIKLAIATGGKLINLPGGLPITVEGCLVGGIGVGSGTGVQDLEVAQAALAAMQPQK